MNDFMKSIDTVEPSQGFSNEPLKKGEYPLTVEAIERGESKQGVPFAKLQLRVNSGPKGVKGRVLFNTFYFGAGKVKTTYEDGKPQEYTRTPEEYAKATDSAAAMVKGFMKAIEVGFGSAVDGPYSYCNVDQWQGRTFIGNVGIDRQRPDQNSLDNYYSNTDPKHGLSHWENVVLPKLMGATGKVMAGERL